MPVDDAAFRLALSQFATGVTVVITPSGNPLLHPITTSFTSTISGNGNGTNRLKTTP